MDELGLALCNPRRQFDGGRRGHWSGTDSPERVDRLVLIDRFPDHVRERLVSPLMRRAVDTHAPAWLASFGASLFGNRAMEAMLKEIVYDHTLVTPLVIDRSTAGTGEPT